MDTETTLRIVFHWFHLIVWYPKKHYRNSPRRRRGCSSCPTAKCASIRLPVWSIYETFLESSHSFVWLFYMLFGHQQVNELRANLITTWIQVQLWTLDLSRYTRIFCLVKSITRPLEINEMNMNVVIAQFWVRELTQCSIYIICLPHSFSLSITHRDFNMKNTPVNWTDIYSYVCILVWHTPKHILAFRDKQHRAHTPIMYEKIIDNRNL